MSFTTAAVLAGVGLFFGQPSPDRDSPFDPVVVGWVFDRDGRAVAGARILFVGMEQFAGVDFQATSDGSGHYRHTVPAGWSGVLRFDENFRLSDRSDAKVSAVGPAVRRDLIAYRNFFVDPTGCDGAEGYSILPFRTIQRAVDLAGPGDTIYVRSGHYDLTQDAAYQNAAVHFHRAGERGEPITLQAVDGAAASLTTAESKPVFDLSDPTASPTGALGHIVFRGLRIVGGRCGWMFRPSVPESWHPDRDSLDHLLRTQVHDVLIEDCEVDGGGVMQSAIYARNGGVRHLTVRRCRFHHTVGTEGTVDIGEWRDDHPAHRIPRSASSRLLFEDCDFHDALHQQANGVVFQPCVHDVTLRRCRAWNNGKYGFACKGSGGFRLDRCAAWGNDSTQMYCRGFGGDDDTGRPFDLNDFLITNSVFIAPPDQRGGAAVNWRENCDLRMYHCTIVGLRDSAFDEAGGYAFLLGHEHDVSSAALLKNCIVAGFRHSPAMRFHTGPEPFIRNMRYEGETNLFFAVSETEFKYQARNWQSLREWQAYWSMGEPGGDNALNGPAATDADATSRFADPGFIRLDPSAVPSRRQWTSDFLDAANHADFRVRPTSAAVSFGENLSDLRMPELLVDYAGCPRPTNGPWTVGAFEPSSEP
jgi:hypothetical protein